MESHLPLEVEGSCPTVDDNSNSTLPELESNSSSSTTIPTITGTEDSDDFVLANDEIMEELKDGLSRNDEPKRVETSHLPGSLDDLITMDDPFDLTSLKLENYATDSLQPVALFDDFHLQDSTGPFMYSDLLSVPNSDDWSLF